MRTFHDPTRRAHGADDRRRGTIMVVFALIVFALMGLAAIAIDVGLASLTQSQMQTAVDTAALEGVQHRDFHDYRWKSNSYRRPRASELVRHVFDDDFHPTGGIAATEERPALPPDSPDLGNFGAGPLLSVTPTPDMPVSSASQTLGVPAVPVLDDPVLQTNSLPSNNDQAAGDMLSGTYSHDADPLHVEASDYTREDFERATTQTAARQALGFLVRMRRTSGDAPLDAIPSVSSRGPTLPLLFGLGTTIHAADGGAYDPRLDGLTVRAAAIAAARPAMAVGPVPLGPSGLPILNRAWPTSNFGAIRGLAPVAVEKDFWTDLVHAYPQPQTELTLVDLDGDSVRESLVDGTGVVRGRCDPMGTCVGRRVLPTGPPPSTSRDAYFAIYAEIPSDAGANVERVIGYGYGRVSFTEGETKLFIRKGIPDLDEDAIPPDTKPCAVIVAADNASAHLSSSNIDGLDLSADEWESVFAEHVDFVREPDAPDPPGQIPSDWRFLRRGTLLAPALVR